MARVLVSAAHTLMSPGAVYQDLKEADITRNLLKKIIPHLTAKKIEFQAVPLDLHLINRIDWINNTGYAEELGDIFIEIHVNDGGKRGFETWYNGKNEAGNVAKALAEFVTEDLCKATGFTNQGVRSEYEHQLKSLAILNSTNPTAIAIECLYIDNAEDIAILKDEAKLDDLAKKLVDSIDKYLKQAPPPQPKAKVDPMPAFPSFDNMDNDMSSLFPPMGNDIPAASKPAAVMDREERKEMIKKVYKKFLGKEEPPPGDMTHYLNTAASEEMVVKRITESPEFKQMVEDALEYVKLKDEAKRMEAENAQLKASVNDLRAIQESMNRLMQHKNFVIQNLQNELTSRNIILPGQYMDGYSSTPQANAQKPGDKKNKGLFR